MSKSAVLVALTSACFFAACRVRANILHDVVDIVEKELNFFSEDYSSINVDGLFGLRLGQGQLQEAVKICNKKACGASLQKTLQSIEAQLNTACDSALPYVEQADPAYYERFIATIDGPYVNPYTPTKFATGQDYKGTNSNYDEERGDACYARMMGTFSENGANLPKCNITDDCWDYMTQGGTSGYFITHQLLYFIMVDHVGCRSSLDQYLNGRTLFDVQKDFCQKVYKESELLAKSGKVSTRRKDLFLEQTVLCGPLGFEDFMRVDWMKMVLTWPDKRIGCFRAGILQQIENALLGPIEKKVETFNEESDTEKSAQLQNLGNLFKSGLQKFGPRNIYSDGMGRSSMRKLQREKAMKDGCLSHTSGLGFGVLCTYLRYLVMQL